MSDAPAPTDADLAALLAIRDELVHFVARRVGDRAAAEDLVQDALLAAVARREELASPRAWIYRVLRNAIVDRARHAQVVAAHAARESASALPSESPRAAGSSLSPSSPSPSPSPSPSSSLSSSPVASSLSAPSSSSLSSPPVSPPSSSSSSSPLVSPPSSAPAASSSSPPSSSSTPAAPSPPASASRSPPPASWSPSASPWAPSSPGSSSWEPELADAVCRCVMQVAQSLSPAHADALHQIEIEDRAVADYAHRAGITANAAGVRIFRARAALRARLAQVCGACATHGCRDCTCRPPAPSAVDARERTD